MNMINGTIEQIKKVTGLTLTTTDTKITKKHGKMYFNIDVTKSVSESSEYDMLERYANRYKTIEVQPNGACRIAIFIL